MDSPKCLIMLAAYNGGKYLKGQIESILNQTYSNFDLMIRDDGSSDNTVQIVKNYQKKDSRVILVRNESNLHGAYHNFHELIVKAKTMPPYDYYLFSDQDDIWVSTKIEKLVACMQKTAGGKPAMVYTDLAMIDGSDKLLNKSIDKEIGLNLEGQMLSEYFIHAYVWGCASIINRKLFQLVPALDSSVKIRNSISHDNYYAKCAIAFGTLHFYPEPLILHRRHGDNVSDSHRTKMSPAEIIRQGTVGLEQLAESYAKVYSQTLFMIRYLRQHQLNAKIFDEVENVIRNGGFTGVSFLRKHQVKRRQKVKTLAVYWITLTKKYQKYLTY